MSPRTLVLVAVAVFALGACKKGESSGASADGKPSADDCKKAFDHWADVSAKKNGGPKEAKLSIQTGNIASCPTMMSAAGIKCLNGLTEVDVHTWPTCLGKK